MSVQQSNRLDDEDIIYILKVRRQYGPQKTADSLGIASSRVRTICNRIMNDDLKHSIKDNVETKQQVMAGYWRK